MAAPTEPTTAPPPSPGSGLRAGLRNRHMTMISIGGVIGAGLFVGSGAAIHSTGPAILLSYVLISVLVVLVMRMLGEMAVAHPASGSFSEYADRALGRWAGFTIGWLYWFFWVVVLAIESTAGGTILNGWVPAVPQWGWTLLVMVLLTATNLISVGSYGEFEFWFAGIKVAAIGAFLVIGVLAVLGVIGGDHATGFSNLTSHGGFLPNGVGALLAGVVTVAFSFPGSEIATLAAAESDEPARAITKAVNSVVWRVTLFYIGSVFLVLCLLPWNDKDVAKSPYVAVLDHIGIPGAGQIMNVIVLTAVLSCFNSGLYSASRMVFSLARRGDAPKALGRTSGAGVPRSAVLVSVIVGFIGVFFNYTSPDTVFQFLLNSTGAIALFMWLVICVTQLRMRRILEREAPERLIVKMWAFPYLNWVAIAFIAFIVVYMLVTDSTRSQMVLSLGAAAVILVASFIVQARRREGAELSA
ncbi:amino acid permease [Streptomyces beihaiensis]|uniref:Amino acid permease n=1 Tax=Streptomyces beihaiensis TaxID=2984495 RepID=A0ABT3U0T5_9ACTN|nr:amino acid permease [Streptomyces beihaiensis]MCX3062930.1 amino acid permease [Streptomyces beihaiensis]